MADDTSIPHFFMPLIPGFLTNFCIPKAFLRHLNLNESNNGGEFAAAVLKDRNSDTDKAWPVKVDSDGRRFMDGWKEFAQDHSLRVGDFLVFRYSGGFVFDVLVLDTVTACERFSVDPLIQSKSDRSEINEQITESESAPLPSTGDAFLFDPVSLDPLIQSEHVQSETNEQHIAESEQTPSPSKGNAKVFDPVTADPLIQSKSDHSEMNEQITESESAHSTSHGDALAFDTVSVDPLIQSETNEQHVTESEQMPSLPEGNALVFDPVTADSLIQSEFVHSKTNEQHITECEPMPSLSKGDTLIFDPVSADPLIQSESEKVPSPCTGNALVIDPVTADPLTQPESVHSETNEFITETENVPSSSKSDALVFDPVTADPLIQSESVHSEPNEHVTESKQVPLPSKGDDLVIDPVSGDPLIQSESAQSEINKQHLTESEQVPSPPKGDASVLDPVSAADPLIQSESAHSETNEHNAAQSEINEQHMTESEQVPSPPKGDASVLDPVSAADPPIQSESVHSETIEHNAEERFEFKPSGRPYFCIPIKKYSITWHAILIPTNFARKNNLAKRWCEMIIIDQKDRSWPVTLRYRKTGKDQAYLAAGWDQVREANGLKLGDSLVFEVIDSGSQPVMKLYKVS